MRGFKNKNNAVMSDGSTFQYYLSTKDWIELS